MILFAFLPVVGRLVPAVVHKQKKKEKKLCVRIIGGLLYKTDPHRSDEMIRLSPQREQWLNQMLQDAVAKGGNSLQLRGKKLTDQDMGVILVFLQQNPQISDLDLSKNQITNNGAKEIALTLYPAMPSKLRFEIILVSHR